MITGTDLITIESTEIIAQENADKTVDFVQAQAASLRLQFADIMGISHDGKRNLYGIYGYPSEVSFDQMWAYSRRMGVANRITHGVAKSCWRDGFEVYADSKEDADKVLEDQLQALKASGLNRKLEQADILNRIGRFSVMFVGVPDGREPHLPVGKVPGDKLDQIYFKAYAYDGIQISQQVNDPTNPRFGLPEMYQVQKMQRSGSSGKDVQQESINVHWTRIVHMNEEALDSDVEGMGQLEPIFNRILDLDKATGGSAEAYFRNAKGKMAYEVDPKFASSLTDTKVQDSFKKGAEEFTNEFQDFILAVGAKAKGIDTPHATPKDTVMAAYWEISAYTGIAIRLLIGEGSGQLAGSEDQLSYNAIVAARQDTLCAIWVLNVLKILQMAGMLDLDPAYDVRFPHQQPVTEAQAAEIANKKADTIGKIATAASSIGGDGINVEETLGELGIDIEVDEIGDMDTDEVDENGEQLTKDPSPA